MFKMRKGEYKTFYKAFNPYVTHFEQKKKEKLSSIRLREFVENFHKNNKCKKLLYNIEHL